VSRLVRENGERPGGLARGHFALERKPVEVEAAGPRQVGEVASDGGSVVCVLDDANVVAGLVTVDRDRLRRDVRGFIGETRRRLGPRIRIERVLAGAGRVDPEDQCEPADDTEAGERRTGGRRRRCSGSATSGCTCFFLAPLAHLGDQRLHLFVSLARVRDPELLVSLAVK